MIIAGLLRHRVTIQTPVSTVDATGRRATGLVRGATIPAEVSATAAIEQTYADGVALRTTYSIRVRAASARVHGLTTATVLDYDGRSLQVTSTRKELEQDDVLIVEATETA